MTESWMHASKEKQIEYMDKNRGWTNGCTGRLMDVVSKEWRSINVG